MEFQIRPMRAEDVEAVARLEALCFSKPWSEESLLSSLSLHNYSFFCAKYDGETVGYVGAYRTVDELNITNIAVFPLWQGRGVGTLLLRALDELAVRGGLYGITLEVRASNAAAIHLYEKNGYEKSGIRKGFYDNPREDGLIMWKYFQQ